MTVAVHRTTHVTSTSNEFFQDNQIQRAIVPSARITLIGRSKKNISP